MTDDLVTLMRRRSTTTQSDCWEWIGARTTAGYGEIRKADRNHYIHRLSWEYHNGPIPSGLHVLHRCDNPPCWNPSHLFLGVMSMVTSTQHEHIQRHF